MNLIIYLLLNSISFTQAKGNGSFLMKENLEKLLPSWATIDELFIFKIYWPFFIFLILITFLLRKIIYTYIIKLLKIFSKKLETKISIKTYKSLSTPLIILSISIVWISSLPLWPLSPETSALLLKIGKAFLYFGIVSLTYQLSNIFIPYFEKQTLQHNGKIDLILFPLIKKGLRVLLFLLGFFLIGGALGFDLKGPMAGLGLGGLAFALAAKDTLSNLFGSLTVLIDRPFQVGDWVVIGTDIEGTIEEVGLRSTRVRTFYDSLVTVPNGQLTNLHIDNYGRRKFRRFKSTLSLVYDTRAEEIELFCQEIKKLIEDHPLTRKEAYHVYFNSMGDYSLNVILYFFWEVPDWPSELKQRHLFLKDILNLAKDLKISFAFPTQTIEMKQ